MSQAIQVSDEIYRALEALARQQGTTPEALAEMLLKERIAERQAIQRQNAEWEAELDDALARAARTRDTLTWTPSLPPWTRRRPRGAATRNALLRGGRDVLARLDAKMLSTGCGQEPRTRPPRPDPGATSRSRVRVGRSIPARSWSMY